MCKVLLSEHVSGSVHLTVTFVPASLTDVFDSISLTMSTHIPAEDHVPNHAVPAIHAHLQQPEPEASSSPRRKLQQSAFSLTSARKTIQSTVQTLGTVVDDAVAAANLAQMAFTNNDFQSTNSSSTDLVDFNVDNVTHIGPQCQFPFDKTFTKASNSSTDSSSSSSKDADITGTCTNCYAHVGATVTLSIAISRGQLQSSSVIMSGDAKIQATLEMMLDGQYNSTKQKLIRSLQTPSLTFFLGVLPSGWESVRQSMLALMLACQAPCTSQLTWACLPLSSLDSSTPAALTALPTSSTISLSQCQPGECR